jgi:hypothetical protein
MLSQTKFEWFFNIINKGLTYFFGIQTFFKLNLFIPNILTFIFINLLDFFITLISDVLSLIFTLNTCLYGQYGF